MIGPKLIALFFYEKDIDDPFKEVVYRNSFEYQTR